MATATAPATPPPNGFPRQFSVTEYHRMIEGGILTSEDRVELIEGWVMLKMARNPPHDGTLDILDELFRSVVPVGWRVRMQLGLTLTDSEPEPDCVLARGTRGQYLKRHPDPADAGLVVEVSDSTLAYDRNVKARIYARAGLPCYWIVNLVERQVEVYTDPSGPDPAPAYRQRQDFQPGDAVPLVLGGQTVGNISVQDLLP